MFNKLDHHSNHNMCVYLINIHTYIFNKHTHIHSVFSRNEKLFIRYLNNSSQIYRGIGKLNGNKNKST